MSAAVAFRPAPARAEERGYCILYQPDVVNHCPGCGRSHWFVGRASAECAFCFTAIPLATAMNSRCSAAEGRSL